MASDSKRVAFSLWALLALAAPAAALTWADRAALNPARSGHAGGVIADRIYVAGGGYYGSSVWVSRDDAQVYDPVTDRWGPLPLMSVRRLFPAGAVAELEVSPGVRRPALFVAGGWDVSGFPDTDPVLQRSVELYDPVARAWAPFPAALPTSYTVGMSAVTVGNLIYLLGGHDDLAALSDQVLVLDPLLGTVEVAPFSLPAPAAEGAAVAIGQKIYYLGGYEGSYASMNWFNQTRILDLTSGLWSFGEAPPRPTATATAVAAGSTIYLIGGWDAASETYRYVAAYDTVADSWSDETPLNCDADEGVPLLRGRAALTAHVVLLDGQDYVHAVGGSHGTSEPLACHEAGPIEPGAPTDTQAPEFTGVGSARESSCPADDRFAIELSWPEALDATPPVLYQVYRSTDAGFTPGPANRIGPDVAALGYTDSLAAGDCAQTFWYVVRARDSALPANQDQNLNRLGLTLACQAPPAPPALGNLLRVTHVAGGVPDLSWTDFAAPAAVSHYHVYRAQLKTGLPGTRVGDPTARVWSDPDPAELEYYQVRPAIDCGDLESGD